MHRKAHIASYIGLEPWHPIRLYANTLDQSTQPKSSKLTKTTKNSTHFRSQSTPKGKATSTTTPYKHSTSYMIRTSEFYGNRTTHYGDYTLSTNTGFSLTQSPSLSATCEKQVCRLMLIARSDRDWLSEDPVFVDEV